MHPPSHRNIASLELLLGSLTAIGPLSIDMYLPAMPAIALDLRASPAAVQLTLSSFFVGFAAGQLVSGPLIDRFGRKLPLMVGLALYVLASWGCAMATTEHAFVALRCLQALSGAVAVVVPRAIVRDLHSGAESARMLSRLMLVMGAAPILAPLIGGGLLHAFGWRAIFMALGAAGLLLLAWSAMGLDAHGTRGRSRVPLRAAIDALLTEPEFVRYAFAGGFGQSAMFAYIAGSSFAFIDVHGLSPTAYSLTFGLNAGGLIACSQFNRHLLVRTPPKVILKRASRVACATACVLALVTWKGLGGVYALEACLFVLISVLGFVGPNATALALEHHGERAGVASSVLGAGQFGLAAAASAAVSAFSAHGPSAMGAVVAAAATLCLLVVERPPRSCPA